MFQGIELVDEIATAVWHRNGGAPFTAAQAFAALPPSARAQVVKLISEDAVMREHAAASRVGRILARAVATGYRTGDGLGVARVTKSHYHVVRLAGAARLEVVDRAEAIESVQLCMMVIANLDQQIGILREQVRALQRALEREGTPDPQSDTDGELLASIARSRGDSWIGLRELRPWIGRGAVSTAKWLQVVARGGTAELMIESGRDPVTARRRWRVLVR